jgi:lipopolysaccharide export system permease protein
MAEHYLYHSLLFFDLTGPILTILSVIVAFALFQRNGEIHPLLAAGVPVYRLVVPFIITSICISGVLVLNRELVIPHFAHTLQTPTGKDASSAVSAQGVYDSNRILISGKDLYLSERKLKEAEFMLAASHITHEVVTLSAPEAVYFEREGKQPSGWLLKNVTPKIGDLPLAVKGKEIVLPTSNPNEIFIVTDIGFDQLYHRNTSFKLLSTVELVRRIKGPSAALMSARGQIVYLHERLTQPLTILVAVMLTVPFIMRKESNSIILKMAGCIGVMGILFVVSQAFLYAGRINLVEAELAAWGPIILSGTLSIWFSGLAQS